jgi:radical SAM-linked protein
MIRCRVLYRKTEPLRYTGMLDIQHLWERLFRRAHLDLAYSHGFHPQPRIQQAAPLPLGFLSSYELLDFWLEGSDSVKEIIEKIVLNTHPGIEIIHIEEIDPLAPILQSHLVSSTYLVTSFVEVDQETITGRWTRLLTEEKIIRSRRGKEYDLRPLILSINGSKNENGSTSLQMTLSAREAATGRPEEVISTMEMDPFSFRYERVSLIFTIPVFSQF